MEENTGKDYIDKQVTKFVNSDDFPEALQRLAEEVPFDVFRNLLIKYLKVITSILDKMFEVLGLDMENPEALEKNLEKATERFRFITWVMIEVLKDPTIRENIRQLAIALNDSALRPFLNAALLTMDEMRPAIDIATDKLSEKIRKGLRKLGDAVIGAGEDVIGTTPYIGNVWNATSGIMNALQGVQAIVDTFSEVMLETTFRLLLIMKKIKGPGLDAVDSAIDFGLNAYNTYQSVIAKIDSVNAMAKGVDFDPNKKLISKKEYVNKVESAGEKAGMVETPDVKPEIESQEKPGAKPEETPGAKPNAEPNGKPTAKPAGKPTGKPVQKGGAKSKKKHQKKRTRKGRFRKTRRRRGGNEQPLLEDEKVEEAIKLPAAVPEPATESAPEPVAAPASESLPSKNDSKSQKEPVVFSMGNVELNAKKSSLSNFVDKEENYKKVQNFLTKIHVSNVPTKQQIKLAISNSKNLIVFNKEDSNRANVVKITAVLLPKLSKKSDILYDLTK